MKKGDRFSMKDGSSWMVYDIDEDGNAVCKNTRTGAVRKRGMKELDSLRSRKLIWKTGK